MKFIRDDERLIQLGPLGIARAMRRAEQKFEKVLRNHEQRESVISEYREIQSLAFYSAGSLTGSHIAFDMVAEKSGSTSLEEIQEFRMRLENERQNLAMALGSKIEQLYNRCFELMGEEFLRMFRKRGAPRKIVDPHPATKAQPLSKEEKRAAAQIDLMRRLVLSPIEGRRTPLHGLEAGLRKYQDAGLLELGKHEADARRIRRLWSRCLEADEDVTYPEDMAEKVRASFGLSWDQTPVVKARSLAARFHSREADSK